MNFVPSSVKAEEWGISQRRVAIFCKEGRVPGAELIGNRWFLPIDAEKPGDPRKARKSTFGQLDQNLSQFTVKHFWSIGPEVLLPYLGEGNSLCGRHRRTSFLRKLPCNFMRILLLVYDQIHLLEDQL